MKHAGTGISLLIPSIYGDGLFLMKMDMSRTTILTSPTLRKKVGTHRVRTAFENSKQPLIIWLHV